MSKLTWVFAVFFLTLTGCGKLGSSASSSSGPSTPDPSGVVTKAQSVIQVSVSGPSKQSVAAQALAAGALNASGTIPVNTTVDVSTNFDLDASHFKVPNKPKPFAINDFGTLKIKTLQDNNLDVCGADGKTHCGTALIRIYTTGTPGPGLWNTVDQYGLPIASAQQGVTPQLPVGLDTAGAAVVEKFSIPADQHVVTLSDFKNPIYDLKVDFTNAGAGSYSTNLVLEYALAP